jgi:hypothetical protein
MGTDPLAECALAIMAIGDNNGIESFLGHGRDG